MSFESLEGQRIFDQVVQLEKHYFPEFEGSNAYSSPDSRYLYFSPTYFLKRELLDMNGLLEVVYNNKSLLSVGSGKGYIERMLILLGAKKEHIVMSDINPMVLPTGYRTQAFDMTQPWPDFGGGFDYVVFPESMLGVSAKHNFVKDAPYLQDLNLCFERAFDVLNPNGQIRAVSWFSSEASEYIEHSFTEKGAVVQAERPELLVIKKVKSHSGGA